MCMHCHNWATNKMDMNAQVARIVESKNSDYQKGKLLVGSMGWTTYSVVDPTITQV